MTYPLAAVRNHASSASSAPPPPSPVAASGYFTFVANPVDGDAPPELDGYKETEISFKEIAEPTHWQEIQIGVDLPATLVALVAALEVNKTSITELEVASYSTDGIDKLIVTYDTPGIIRNSFTLGASTANITRSAPTLTGGVD